MSKPKLYVMCGLSGSGKSTIAKQIVNDNPDTVVISTDMRTINRRSRRPVSK